MEVNGLRCRMGELQLIQWGGKLSIQSRRFQKSDFRLNEQYEI